MRLPPAVVVAAAVLGACAPSGTGGALAPSESSIDALLTLSELEAVTVGRAGAFTRQVALMAGDLSDEELERLVPAVREGFDPVAFRRDVAAMVTTEAPEGWIDEVLGWMRSGANADVQTISAAYTPPVPLRKWLETSTTTPPSVDRVRLVGRWTDARSDGVFFLLLEQALDEGAHRVWAAFRPDADPFTPLAGDELADRLDTSFMAAAVTALHENETVPDDLIRAAAIEYETAAGRWYVEAYQLAVAEAVRAATDRVLRILASAGESGAE